jgi:hypothetical protein
MHLALQSIGHSGLGGQSLGQIVVIAAFFVTTEFLEEVKASNSTDIPRTVVTMMVVNLLFISIVFSSSNLTEKLKPSNGGLTLIWLLGTATRQPPLLVFSPTT